MEWNMSYNTLASSVKSFVLTYLKNHTMKTKLSPRTNFVYKLQPST